VGEPLDCQQAAQELEDALEDAEVVIEMRPANRKDLSKAQYSKAVARQALGKIVGALEACMAGLDEDPDNKALL